MAMTEEQMETARTEMMLRLKGEAQGARLRRALTNLLKRTTWEWMEAKELICILFNKAQPDLRVLMVDVVYEGFVYQIWKSPEGGWVAAKVDRHLNESGVEILDFVIDTRELGREWGEDTVSVMKGIKTGTVIPWTIEGVRVEFVVDSGDPDETGEGGVDAFRKRVLDYLAGEFGDQIFKR